MPATPETLDRIRTILRSSLKLDSGAEIGDEMPLIGGEYDLDSLDVLLVITTIEQESGVRIRAGVMARSPFATLGALADFVEKLRHES